MIICLTFKKPDLSISKNKERPPYIVPDEYIPSKGRLPYIVFDGYTPSTEGTNNLDAKLNIPASKTGVSYDELCQKNRVE